MIYRIVADIYKKSIIKIILIDEVEKPKKNYMI